MNFCLQGLVKYSDIFTQFDIISTLLIWKFMLIDHFLDQVYFLPTGSSSIMSVPNQQSTEQNVHNAEHIHSFHTRAVSGGAPLFAATLNQFKARFWRFWESGSNRLPPSCLLHPAPVIWVEHLWVQNQCLIPEIWPGSRRAWWAVWVASWVGGIFFRVLDLCVKSFFLPSFTSMLSLVRSYISTTNRSGSSDIDSSLTSLDMPWSSLHASVTSRKTFQSSRQSSFLCLPTQTQCQILWKMGRVGHCFGSIVATISQTANTESLTQYQAQLVENLSNKATARVSTVRMVTFLPPFSTASTKRRSRGVTASSCKHSARRVKSHSAGE